MHYHKVKEGYCYLPSDIVVEAQKSADTAEGSDQEWNYLSEEKYFRVTRRLDKLLGIN